jgi:hypothetical protein
VQREITPLWGKKKVVLRQTPRAVTPFGGLSVLIEFLGKIGYRQQVSEHLPVHLRSPNAIDPAQTFTAFLISVVAGAPFCGGTGGTSGGQALAGPVRRLTDSRSLVTPFGFS